VGHVADSVVASIEALGLQPWVNIRGYLPHHQARQAQWSADVLLLVEASQPWASEIIPGKFFEYMETQKPLLALGPDRWDVHEMMSQTQTGFFAESADDQRIESLLWSLWQDHQRGVSPTNPMGTERYTRQHITAQLAKLLHDHTV
jgi:hypothetical protein